MTLELEPPGGALPFAPGQFNMLYAFGVGEVPISLSGDPRRPDRLLHTVRAVGDATRALCALRAGQSLGIRGPFGTPWPLQTARGADVVVVAGGIGLAPLRPAILAVLGERRAYGRVAVVYGARAPQSLLFRRELERWRGRLDTEVHVTVDAAGADWRGRVGVVTEALPRLRFDVASAVALVCGPEVMMRFAARELAAAGVPPERIFVSLERNMKCGVGLCGHCQLGPLFVCRDGPVFSYARLAPLLRHREL
jgi:NAD(P)H-flavin reductase